MKVSGKCLFLIGETCSFHNIFCIEPDIKCEDKAESLDDLAIEDDIEDIIKRGKLPRFHAGVKRGVKTSGNKPHSTIYGTFNDNHNKVYEKLNNDPKRARRH